jgi:sorting nexin-29
MPENWQPAIICPIHKKGYKLQCSNYRGSFLLNICYKVLTNILPRELVPYAKEILGDYQRGFRKGRSTTDSLFKLNFILDKFYELNVRRVALIIY